MAFNINEILARISANGLARNNKFMVSFPIPNIFNESSLPQSLQLAGNSIQFAIEETAIPGMAMLTHPHRRYGYGPSEDRPFAAGFGKFPCMVRGDMNGDFYKFFYAWSRGIVNPDFGDSISSPSSLIGDGTRYPYEVAYKDDYAVTVTITTYRDDGQPSLVIQLREAYPEYFGGDTVLSWHKKNEYLRFPVNFTFIDMSVSDVSDASSFSMDV